MLFDAIERVTRLSAEIGGTMLIVNAKPSAISFYSRYGFEQMKSHPHNLFLPIFCWASFDGFLCISWARMAQQRRSTGYSGRS